MDPMLRNILSRLEQWAAVTGSSVQSQGTLTEFSRFSKAKLDIPGHLALTSDLFQFISFFFKKSFRRGCAVSPMAKAGEEGVDDERKFHCHTTDKL